jgi:diketogulonate reductase-like aldo/keto reductase
MEELVDEGYVKSIGVSNWTVPLLLDLYAYARHKPVVNQFEVHPYNPRDKLVRFCQSKDVVPVGYRLIYKPP